MRIAVSDKKNLHSIYSFRLQWLVSDIKFHIVSRGATAACENNELRLCHVNVD